MPLESETLPTSKRPGVSTGPAVAASTPANRNCANTRPTTAGCHKQCPSPPNIHIAGTTAANDATHGTYHGAVAGSVSPTSRPVRAA